MNEAPSPWKRRAYVGCAWLVTLAAAFSAGRFSAPLEVQTVDKVVWKEREQTNTAETTKKAKAKLKKVVTDTVKRPDGTVVVKRVETVDERSGVERMAEGVTVRDVAGDSVKQTTTTLRPNWRVTLQVGASWQPPALTFAGPIVVGAQVDRRIYGGLTAGVWFNTFGAGGLGASMEF